MACCSGTGTVPSTIINTAMARLPGVSQDAVELELSNTIRDFCNETTVWRDDITIEIDLGEREYLIIPTPPRTEVVNVLGVRYNGLIIPPRAGNMPLADQSAWFFDGMSFGKLIITEQMAASGGTLTVHMFIRPCDGGVEIPAMMEARYYEVLLAGLLGRMYSHKNRPYFDREMAEFNRRNYHGKLPGVRRIATHHNAAYGRSWTFPQFASGTGAGRRGSYYRSSGGF